jgi:hypothetical protein
MYKWKTTYKPSGTSAYLGRTHLPPHLGKCIWILLSATRHFTQYGHIERSRQDTNIACQSLFLRRRRTGLSEAGIHVKKERVEERRLCDKQLLSLISPLSPSLRPVSQATYTSNYLVQLSRQVLDFCGLPIQLGFSFRYLHPSRPGPSLHTSRPRPRTQRSRT